MQLAPFRPGPWTLERPRAPAYLYSMAVLRYMPSLSRRALLHPLGNMARLLCPSRPSSPRQPAERAPIISILHGPKHLVRLEPLVWLGLGAKTSIHCSIRGRQVLDSPRWLTLDRCFKSHPAFERWSSGGTMACCLCCAAFARQPLLPCTNRLAECWAVACLYVYDYGTRESVVQPLPPCIFYLLFPPSPPIPGLILAPSVPPFFYSFACLLSHLVVDGGTVVPGLFKSLVSNRLKNAAYLVTK
ncbi:hypothetical protein GGR57DRAFT_262943 [Xylariaceae sp. FL1272]|nr:hypothetical protein GGR57DRAFT_262943 [Xylariaceae sp. FL1272]